MSVTATNLCLGPGTLYTGAFGAAEPADADVNTTPEVSAWTDLGGTPGRFYNQTISGDHYITQEEFSNADWFNSPLVPNSTTRHTGGCVRGENVVTPAP